MEVGLGAGVLRLDSSAFLVSYFVKNPLPRNTGCGK